MGSSRSNPRVCGSASKRISHLEVFDDMGLAFGRLLYLGEDNGKFYAVFGSASPCIIGFGNRRKPNRVCQTNLTSTPAYSKPFFPREKLDCPISGARLIQEMGESTTLYPINSGFRPVSALAANHAASKSRFSTTSRRSSFRLLVKSRSRR